MDGRRVTEKKKPVGVVEEEGRGCTRRRVEKEKVGWMDRAFGMIR